MSTSNCPGLGPQDSLQRDHLVPIDSGGAKLVGRLAIAALAGLALAVVASLTTEPSDGQALRDRLSVPERAAPLDGARLDGPRLDGHGKWGGYTR